MAEVSIIEHTESTVSSVRSTVSTASSGYAIISVPGKQREDVRTVYPAEPPPDYDDPPIQKDEFILPRYTEGRQSSPKKDYESRVPLLSQDTAHREIQVSRGDLQPSISKVDGSSRPLLTEGAGYQQQQQQKQPQTIVRISSKSQDLNIEIVSTPTLSPPSTTADTSFVYTPSEMGGSNSTRSPASTAADTSFLYKAPDTKQTKRKCRKMTKCEKILLVGVIVLLIALVLVLNFTVCIGDFTSACK